MCRQDNLKKKFLATVSALTILTILVTNAYAHDIHYNANTYPFTFPDYGTAIGFSTNMIFDNVCRVDDFWYFDNDAFQVQAANLTVQDFFVLDSYKMSLIIDAPTGTISTTKFMIPSKGSPIKITGDTAVPTWSYNALSGIVTMNIVHASSVTVVVDYTPLPVFVSGGHDTLKYMENVFPNSYLTVVSCKWVSSPVMCSILNVISNEIEMSTQLELATNFTTNQTVRLNYYVLNNRTRVRAYSSYADLFVQSGTNVTATLFAVVPFRGELISVDSIYEFHIHVNNDTSHEIVKVVTVKFQLLYVEIFFISVLIASMIAGGSYFVGKKKKKHVGRRWEL